jgi:hypothetical protein
VDRHTVPKNTSAPRVLREQFGTISIRSCKLLATLEKARPLWKGAMVRQAGAGNYRRNASFMRPTAIWESVAGVVLACA